MSEERERDLDDTGLRRREAQPASPPETSTDRSKWFQLWLSPGIIMGLIGWLALLAGAWYRLSALEGKFQELSATVKVSTEANQRAEVELVRYQERAASLASRLAVLEEKMANQEQINVRVFSGLAKLGG